MNNMIAILRKYINNQHNYWVLNIPLEDGKYGTITIEPDIFVSDCRRNEENKQIEIWLKDHSFRNGDSPDITISIEDTIVNDNIIFAVTE